MGGKAQAAFAHAHHNVSQFHLQRGSRVLRLCLTCLFVLGMPCPVSAGEWSVILNGKAIHFENPAGTNYNESNWGFGAQYDFALRNGNWVPFVTASWFIDSNENPSYYGGGGIAKRVNIGPNVLGMYADIGVVGFMMLRDNFRGNLPFLGALPVMTVGAGRVAVNITYIPKTDPKGVPIAFFQLKIGLGRNGN